jgi:hypothetical protein
MSVAELVLDYIQALIWPALIAVGVFWLFRSQLGSLLAERRVKRVEAAGVKIELEQVAEVLQASVDETREEVAKAENPEERERAVEKLERETAALARVEVFQQTVSHPATWEQEFKALWADPTKNARRRRVVDYGNRARWAVVNLSAKEGADRVLDPTDELDGEFHSDGAKGIPVEETIARLGPPDQWAANWFNKQRETEAQEGS